MNAAAADAIVASLLAATGAGRTTLRLDRPPDYFPVVAEACAPAVRSIRHDVGVDLRAAPTFTEIRDRLEVIVQDDCRRSAIPTPEAVIERYGVRAQMLAPVAVDGRLVGTISVHHTAGPRRWSQADRDALTGAVRAVLDELSRDPAPGA